MKQSAGVRVFMAFNIIFMLFISAVMLFPYLNVLAKALNDGRDTAIGGITVFPRSFTLENFIVILGEKTMKSSAAVSVLRVVTGVVSGLAVQFSCAYALTKKFPGKGFLLALFTVPMFISAGQIPTYVLFSQVNLLNSFWVYILPGLFSFFNVILIRTFIQATIPDSLFESAAIEGANDTVIFAKIVIPLCMPIMATIALWLMVAHWNDWVTTLLYIRKSSLFTLQYRMMELVKESERIQKMIAAALQSGQVVNVSAAPTSESLIAAQVIITTIPIVMVYPFLQKYFVKGIMLGAVKG
jgi:putative aldouronate transport system permease protein